MKRTKTEKVSAIIITFFPEPDIVLRLANLAQLVDSVFVVDNTSGNNNVLSENSFAENIKIVSMGGNKGIATALNVGAEHAFKSGADFVFFFDQDSNPDLSMIRSLVEIITSFDSNEQIAVVGPAYYDTRLKRKAPFILFHQGKLHRIPPEGKDLIDADYLITSGSLISRQSWRAIGCHDDSLFIDYVDIEWCLRAKSLGWRVLGVPYVVMEHTLGDEPITVFGKKLPVHSPIRHYYFFRNCISLLYRNYIPISFKIRESFFLPIRFFVYALFTKNRLEHISKMCKGIFDGFISKSGPYQ